MRKFGRNYVCKMNDELDIKLGDICVVDLGRAEDYGKVLEIKNKPKEEEIKNSIVRKIKRLLTDKDKQRIQENKAKEEYAYQKCLRRIADHKLDMKLVGVEYSLDCSRIIFYFTADGRIDFRELVKSLATEFRARIELRQIGVRDESKMLGGLGCCGRQLCCSTFLYNFEPINIRMAKIQRLPLNPSKISGLCGRLHCCLRYEYKFYRKASRGMPREGSLVSTKSGEGRIFDINIIKRTVFIFLENGKVLEAPVDEIKILKTQRELEPDKKLVKPMMSEHVDVQELKKLEDIPGADFDDDDDDF
ncbi:stage 0 sporulation protein [bacterium]|nr:stage 0 sporulation protein [bacterium]